MELLNEMRAAAEAESGVVRFALESAVSVLAPFVPHIAEELWQRLGHEESIMRSAWPTYDKTATREETVEIVLQVNGKVRSRIEVAAGTSREEMERLALADEKIQHHLGPRQVRKVIVVPERLVNVVAG